MEVKENSPEVKNPEIRDNIADRLKKHNWLEVTQDPICETGGIGLLKEEQYLRILPNNSSPSGWSIEILPQNLQEKTREALKYVLSFGKKKKDDPIKILQEEEDELSLTRQYPRGKNYPVQTYSVELPPAQHFQRIPIPEI